MKERPILFSAPMVRALLAGKKTQTRRLVTLPAGGEVDGTPGRDPIVLWSMSHQPTGSNAMLCPYGVPGDRLWVREAWQTGASLDAFNATQIKERCLGANYDKPWAPIVYQADGAERDYDHQLPHESGGWGPPGRKRLARFMPRWAFRIALEVTEARVQRLGDISEEDARDEGVAPFGEVYPCVSPDQPIDGKPASEHPHRASFAVLWDEINGDRALWSSNPWVWAVSFKVVTP